MMIPVPPVEPSQRGEKPAIPRMEIQVGQKVRRHVGLPDSWLDAEGL
jgi:hypothetical protein